MIIPEEDRDLYYWQTFTLANGEEIEIPTVPRNDAAYEAASDGGRYRVMDVTTLSDTQRQWARGAEIVESA